MIKQEILSKLANNEDLTQEEIGFMVYEFKEVHDSIIEADPDGILRSFVFEVGDDLYYEVTCLESNTDGSKKFESQPRRVKKETKPVESFVRCEN